MPRTWRLYGISESYEVARRQDVPAADRGGVPPQLALLHIDRWLADPYARRSLIEIYESLCGASSHGGRGTRWLEFQGRIKTRVLEGFQRGDLVMVRTPHTGVIPASAKKPEATTEAEENAAEVRPASEEEIYVIAVEVRTIGDTPLVNHKVRVIDPDTGKMVGGQKMTDDKGVVRTVVPEDKQYRIEIVDEVSTSPSPPPLPADYPAGILICHFCDEGGNPIANEPVEISSGEDQFELSTDDDGKIEAPAELAAYELKICGETFVAHPLLWKDKDKAESVYQFVVAGIAQEEGAEASSRLTQYVDMSGDDGGGT